MRIIAGEYRGRQLKSLRGRAVRPTSDKLRETLFNVLRAEVPGAVFLDCYAGSGAVGLEALSRGARLVFFLEQDAAARRVIEQNIAGLEEQNLAAPDPSLDPGEKAQIVRARTVRTQIVRADVRTALRRLAAQGICADICFLDPPYAALAEAIRNLSWLCASALMRAEGIITLEHSRKDPSPAEVGNWSRTRLLHQGSSALSFYRKG